MAPWLQGIRADAYLVQRRVPSICDRSSPDSFHRHGTSRFARCVATSIYDAFLHRCASLALPHSHSDWYPDYFTRSFSESDWTRGRLVQQARYCRRMGRGVGLSIPRVSLDCFTA